MQFLRFFWLKACLSILFFATIGSGISGLVVMAWAFLNAGPNVDAPPLIGMAIAFIPLWIAASILLSLPTGLLAAIGAGFLSAQTRTETDYWWLRSMACGLVAAALAFIGSVLGLADILISQSGQFETPAWVLPTSWFVAGFVCPLIASALGLPKQAKIAQADPLA